MPLLVAARLAYKDATTWMGRGSAMSDDRPTTKTERLAKELELATAALQDPGAGARGNLECRVADLQERLLSTPAQDLADVEARLVVIRDLVRQLGTGYLLDLVTATLADVRTLRARDADA